MKQGVLKMPEELKIRFMSGMICLFFVLAGGTMILGLASRGDYGLAVLPTITVIGICWIMRILTTGALKHTQDQEK
jgi:lipopolysaccharide export LptBFGC system permease protein LptF